MLLSDKYKMIVDELKNVHNEEEVKTSIRLMIMEAWKQLKEELKDFPSDRLTIVAFQRTNNIWNMTRDYAIKNGKDFMKKDGFKLLVLADEKFQAIHKYL